MSLKKPVKKHNVLINLFMECFRPLNIDKDAQKGAQAAFSIFFLHWLSPCLAWLWPVTGTASPGPASGLAWRGLVWPDALFGVGLAWPGLAPYLALV